MLVEREKRIRKRVSERERKKEREIVEGKKINWEI